MPAQIARLAAHGHVRPVQRGEGLAEAGEPLARFFVVTAGQVALVRPAGVTEARVAVLRPGPFAVCRGNRPHPWSRFAETPRCWLRHVLTGHRLA
jgi:hypothetical protein